MFCPNAKHSYENRYKITILKKRNILFTNENPSPNILTNYPTVTQLKIQNITCLKTEFGRGPMFRHGRLTRGSVPEFR